MKTPIYGLMAEFDTPTALAAAARGVREKGYRKVEAYSPFAIEEVNEALGLRRNRLPLIVLTGGILGGLTGYLMQYYIAVWDFPINVGGRPLHSWPSFIIITFELTILFAAFSTVLGLLGLCGLPMPYHPVFNVPRFAQASRNRFFLCIEAADPLFDRHTTAEFLRSLEAYEVSEVAH
jgi:ActD protein